MNIRNRKVLISELKLNQPWKMGDEVMERIEDSILSGKNFIYLNDEEYTYFLVLVIYNGKMRMQEIPVIPDDAVAYRSSIPAFCSGANDILNKNYEKAILDLKGQLQENIYSKYNSMVHINLMNAYFKIKDLDNCNYHAKMALLCGHNTGLAGERLVINLTKDKRYCSAINVCDVMASESFVYGYRVMGSQDKFKERRKKIVDKIDKDLDLVENKYFTQQEIETIYSNTRRNFLLDEFDRMDFNSFRKLEAWEKSEYVNVINNL